MKKGSKKLNPRSINKCIRSRNFRIVIPNLQQYKTASHEALMELKYQILQKILQKQKIKNLQYYLIAIQRHLNGVPHLDILLLYPKSVLFKVNHFDYILKHGDITTYRQLNQAILDYGKKEDLCALSNLPKSSSQIINLQKLNKDPYRYLELKMLQDPLHFNVEEYSRTNDLFQYIKSWSSVKAKLADSQAAAANLLLKTKPGFKLITRELIQAQLSPDQLRIYDSWSGYQTIVDLLNQMILKKGTRDPKSLNLLITGAPNTGKSALVWHPNPHHHFNPISSYCSVYPIGMSQWFPKYRSDVYHCIYWNEAKLTSYSYDTILKLLDGSPLDLPNKGSVSRKVDNPLIIMTSNLTLDQMILQKFGYNKDYIHMARANLAVRVKNVIIPEGYDLFLLQKLFTPV